MFAVAHQLWRKHTQHTHHYTHKTQRFHVVTMLNKTEKTMPGKHLLCEILCVISRLTAKIVKISDEQMRIHFVKLCDFRYKFIIKFSSRKRNKC